MDSKKLIIGVAILITLVNVSFTFAANEPLRNVYSGFGIEDPDADLDGVYGNDDKCPGTSFDIFVFNKNTKKQPAVTEYKAPGDPTKKIHLRLAKVNEKTKTGNNNAVFQTSDTANFAKKKEYTLEPNKITVVDSIGKAFRLLYSHASKGVAVVWTSGLVNEKGCEVR